MAKPEAVAGVMRAGGAAGKFPGIPMAMQCYRLTDSDALTTQSQAGATAVGTSPGLSVDKWMNAIRSKLGPGLIKAAFVVNCTGNLAAGGAPVAVPFGITELFTQPQLNLDGNPVHVRMTGIGNGVCVDIERGLNNGIDWPRLDPPSGAGPFTAMGCYPIQLATVGTWLQLPGNVSALPDWKDTIGPDDQGRLTWQQIQIPGTNAAQGLLNTNFRNRLWTGATGNLTLTTLTLDLWVWTVSPPAELAGLGVWTKMTQAVRIITGVNTNVVEQSFVLKADGDLVMVSFDYADGTVSPSAFNTNPIVLTSDMSLGGQQISAAQTPQTFLDTQRWAAGTRWPHWQPNSQARVIEHSQADRRIVVPGDPMGMGDGLRHGSKMAQTLSYTGDFQLTWEMLQIADRR